MMQLRKETPSAARGNFVISAPPSRCMDRSSDSLSAVWRGRGSITVITVHPSEGNLSAATYILFLGVENTKRALWFVGHVTRLFFYEADGIRWVNLQVTLVWRCASSNEPLWLSPVRNNTSATGAYFCHLILYCKYIKTSLIHLKYIYVCIYICIPAKGKMSVHPRWHRKQKKKRIETPPRIKTPLVHPASSSQKERKKMPTSEKYLTLPPDKSIMKSPPKKRER